MPIKEIIRAKSKDFDGTLKDTEVMALLAGSKIKIKDIQGKEKEVPAKLSRNTYYKYKNEL